MLMLDKKKMAHTIVSKMKGAKPDFVQELGDTEFKPKELNMNKPEVEANEGLLSAADDIMAAIKAGDAKALSSALQAHWEMCDMQEDKYEGEEPAEEMA